MKELGCYAGGVALYAAMIVLLAWLGSRVETWGGKKDPRAGRPRPQDYWDD